MKRPLLKRIRGGWVDPNTGTVPDPAEILSGDDQEPVEVSGLPRADSLEVTTGTRVAPVESSFQRTGISFLPTASAADAQEALRASGASGRKPRDGRRGSFGSFFSGSQNVRPASHTDHSAPTTSAVSEAVNPRGPLNPAKTVSSTYPVDRPRESGRTATNSDDPTSPNPVQGSGNGPTLAAVVASVDEEIAKELVQIVPDTQTTEILAPDLHDDAVDAAKSTEIRAAARGSNFDLGDTPLAREITDLARRRAALAIATLPLPARTRVFTVANQKGGVGKTTSAVNLAAALARTGARVLVIDLDPQGNASTALGVEHRAETPSVYDVIIGGESMRAVVQASPLFPTLFCVPATIHLAGAEIELVSVVAREQRLRTALDTFLAESEAPFHYVFIDCPPSLGLLTINAFVSASEVLIPIQCEYYALEGLSQLMGNIALIEKHLNPTLQVSTILLTMFDSRTNLANQVAQEVREHFPREVLGTLIPRSVRISEAPSYGQTVISYDTHSAGSLSYQEAAAEIAQRGAPN